MGNKYNGVSFPTLVMLWIGLSHGFKQVDNPELPEHAVAYSAAILHLKACGTREAVQKAIWGEDASAGANDLGPSAESPGPSPQGLMTTPAPVRTGTT
jgi:hypothetical protein